MAYWYFADGELLSDPETLPEFKAAEPRDTTPAPPPDESSVDLPRRCYWCDGRAVCRVHGMPACDSCKRRAVGKRRDL